MKAKQQKAGELYYLLTPTIEAIELNRHCVTKEPGYGNRARSSIDRRFSDIVGDIVSGGKTRKGREAAGRRLGGRGGVQRLGR